ncbi:MAG: SGNH/GDSL hydrolase family protein [Azoarcus sp.]|nr:SGNH/GDSL hydrolase family protein [Azoarcus sp.]
MAIKLLQAVEWNGVSYPRGSTPPGLSFGDEAALVGSHRAEWDGQNLQAGGAVPVMGRNNPLTGVVEITAGGEPVSVGGGSSVEGDMRIWRKAMADVARGAGTGADVLLIGDSVMEGLNGGNYMNRIGYGISKRLTARGILSEYNGMLGFGSVTTNATALAADSRIATFGSSNVDSTFAANPTNFTLSHIIGGSRCLLPAIGSPSIEFQPLHEYDRVRVWGQTDPTYATDIVAKSGGVEIGTLICRSGQASSGVANATYSVALNSAPLSFERLNDLGSGRLIGFQAYNSTKPAIRILKAGVSSSRSRYWANNAFRSSPQRSFVDIGAKLVVFMGTINDRLTDPAEYIANLKIIGDAVVAAGGNFLIVPSCETSVMTVSDPIVLAAKQAAIENGFAWFNSTAEFGSYADLSADFYSDTVHPNATGYSDLARILEKAIALA